MYCNYGLEGCLSNVDDRALPLYRDVVCWVRDATPIGLRAACIPFPRAAAKRSNPGLCLSNRFAVLLPRMKDLIRVSQSLCH